MAPRSIPSLDLSLKYYEYYKEAFSFTSVWALMAVPLDFMGEKIAVGILRLTIVSRYPFVFVCLVSKSYIASAVGTGGGGSRGNVQPPHFDGSFNPISTGGQIMPITLLLAP